MGSAVRRQRGITLVELAVVLVVLALMAGGVLAGNEMRHAAKTRGMIGQMEALRAAHFGFVDRYRALPGDFARATREIPGATVEGNGDGLVRTVGTVNEPMAAWEHLSRAGFLNGGYSYSAQGESPASAPPSLFGAYPRLESSNQYAGVAHTRLNLATGNLIPADTLAEIDRKLDDGLATTGSLRFSPVTTAGTPPSAGNCHDGSGQWRIGSPSEPNCGATWLL